MFWVATLAACGGKAPVAPVRAPSAPPRWVVPDGWKAETIPFPLEFAPELPYRGVEELRFPKGFFEAGDPSYFSYAFVWYVVGPGPADAEVLERDLVRYFEGLAMAVGGEPHPARAELAGAIEGGVSGVVETFDAFKAKAPVTLHLKVRRVPCGAPGQVALVFQASPRPEAAGDEVWAGLEALAGAVDCQAAGKP